MDIAVISPGVVLPIALLCGLFSYLLAARNKQLKGLPPWNLHPAWWFAIGFFIGLVGVLLCVIARATTKSRQETFPPGYYGGYPSTGAPGQWQPPPSGQFPGAYPAAPGMPAPSGYPAAGANPMGSGPTTSPPPAWQPDPLGHHELRYWDGTQWTEHVSDAGTQTTDPL